MMTTKSRFQEYLEAASQKQCKAIINGKEFPCKESGGNFVFDRDIAQEVAKEVIKTKKFQQDEGRKGYDYIKKIAENGPEASDNKGSISYKIDSFGISKFYFDNKPESTPKETEPKGEIKSYGYANGWSKTPDVIAKCKHKVERKEIGRCLNEYTCKECGYSYKVDSGD